MRFTDNFLTGASNGSLVLIRGPVVEPLCFEDEVCSVFPAAVSAVEVAGAERAPLDLFFPLLRAINIARSSLGRDSRRHIS